MPDSVKVVLHISRHGGFSGFARKASGWLSIALRIAIVGTAAITLNSEGKPAPEAAAALAVGLVWTAISPLLSRPQAPHATFLVTDESILYAEGATVLDWTDVRSHAVVGDQLLFEATDEARREDPVVKKRYVIPLGPRSREAIIEAFASRPRAART